MKENLTFGDRLRAARKSNGFTQQEIADAAGVNISYISNLERDFSPTAKGGKPQPSAELVAKFEKILQVENYELTLAAGYAPPLDKIPHEIASLPLSDLSPESVRRVARFIEFELLEAARDQNEHSGQKSQFGKNIAAQSDLEVLEIEHGGNVYTDENELTKRIEREQLANSKELKRKTG